MSKLHARPAMAFERVFAWCMSLCAACLLMVADPACAFAGESSSATVIVAGVDDPDADAPRAEPWVPQTEVALEDGQTAWELLRAELDRAGFTYDAPDSTYGVFVQSITSPGGVTLENTSTEPYNFWAFLVNGEMANEGVSAYVVQPGDEIQLAYYPGGEAPLHEAMPITHQEGDAAGQPAGEDAPNLNGPVDHTDYVAQRMVVVGVGLAIAGIAVVYVVRARRVRR